MWNLDEHTRPIARARVSAGGAAMLEIFQNLNTLGDYVMGFFVFEVRNKANSACVMVQGPVIQAFACVSFVSVLNVIYRSRPIILTIPRHSVTSLPCGAACARLRNAFYGWRACVYDCIWGQMPGGFVLIPPSGCCKSSITATLRVEAAAKGPAPEHEGTATLSYRWLKMPDLPR